MKTILIIEDEKKIRKQYSRVLLAISIKEFHILEADSPQQGIDILKENHVDLILLDIKMPQLMNGRDAYEVIQEMEQEDLKILVASAYSTLAQELFIKEADGYFNKSDGPIKLMEKVTTLLSA